MLKRDAGARITRFALLILRDAAWFNEPHVLALCAA